MTTKFEHMPYVSVEEQQQKCLRGEHEREFYVQVPSVITTGGIQEFSACRHCRCLYVGRP